MGKPRQPYAEEFRRQMVDLVRSGQTPEELGRKFDPCAESIRNWVKQADLDEGRRSDGLTHGRSRGVASPPTGESAPA